MPNFRSSALYKRQSGLVPGRPEPEDPPAADPVVSAPPRSTSNPPASSTSRVVATSNPPTVSNPPAQTTSSRPVVTPSSTAVRTTENPVVTTSQVVVLSTSNPVVSSTASVVLVPSTTRPLTSLTPTTRTSASAVFTPTTKPAIARTSVTGLSADATASPSPTSAPEEGTSVGTIIGVIAAGLVGVVALAAVAGWFFRRHFKKKDDFNRQDFLRHSTAIPDDYTQEKVPMGSKNALNLARANTVNNRQVDSRGPRPPSMIERRIQRGSDGDGMPSFQPGEFVQVPQHGYYQDPHAAYQYGGYGQPGAYAHGGYDYNQPQDTYYNYSASAYTPPNEQHQSELTRRPSGPESAYLQRQPSNGGALHSQHPYAASPAGEYAAGRHESVTPYQQQQYAEITRQLNDPSYLGGIPEAPGNEEPAAVKTGRGRDMGRSLSTSYSSLDPTKPSPAVISDMNRSGTPTDPNPQQNYYQPHTAGYGLKVPERQGPDDKRVSVFNADDAYGGI